MFYNCLLNSCKATWAHVVKLKVMHRLKPAVLSPIPGLSCHFMVLKQAAQNTSYLNKPTWKVLQKNLQSVPQQITTPQASFWKWKKYPLSFCKVANCSLRIHRWQECPFLYRLWCSHNYVKEKEELALWIFQHIQFGHDIMFSLSSRCFVTSALKS